MKLSFKIEDATADELIKFFETTGQDKEAFLDEVREIRAYIDYKKDKILDMVSETFPPQYNPETEEIIKAKVDASTNYFDHEFEHAVAWLVENKVELSMNLAKGK